MERGEFVVTRTAMESASEIYCDQEDIRSCVLGLTAADFYKPLKSVKRAGSWQDVYKTHYHSWPIYLKLELKRRGNVVVISFKLDEDP